MSIANPAGAPRPALAAGLAIGCAIVAVVALVTLAKPAGFDARLAAVEQDAQRATHLLRPAGAARGFPADAACSATTDTAGPLRQALSDLAARARLEVQSIEVTPTDATAPREGLVPMRVRFEATGPYDGAIAALSGLATVRPLIFVETMDLTSRTSVVSLVVSGQVYCAASL